MLDTVKINHVQHISFTQSRLTDAVSVILSELLSYEHPSKPVELCEYLIRTYTRPGELVADICAGSGTTAIAAINTERRFVCFETAPSFYAAASERIRAAQAVKSSGEKGV